MFEKIKKRITRDGLAATFIFGFKFTAQKGAESVSGMISFICFYLIEKPLFNLWARKNHNNDLNLPCVNPFTELEVIPNGDCYLCCTGWLPVCVGNAGKKSIKNIFNSVKAQKVRISLYKGNLKYCRKDICNYINSQNPKKIGREELFKADYVPENVKRIIAGRGLIFETGPSRMTELVSDFCNLRCVFCRTDHHPGEKKINDIFYGYISDNASSIKLLNFCGGEPLINPRVKDLMKKMQGSDALFYFTSNLSRIDSETRGLLGKIKLWAVHGSINAATKETYEKICGGKWEETIENLDYILKLREKSANPKKFWVQISMVVTNLNYMEIADFVKLGIFKNVDRIIISPMQESDRNRKFQIGKKEAGEIKAILTDPLFSAEKSRVELEPLRTFVEKVIK